MTAYVPLTNIVMPVFNRHDNTLVALDSVRKMTAQRAVLTVVDNGSKEALRKDLVKLAKEKIIDNLFVLDANYGISPACNLGWRLVDTPFFMKLDNDCEILSDMWLENIYGMWGKDRYTTLMGPAWNCTAKMCRVETACGTKWTLPVSLAGAAFLVSKKVHTQIGFFSEDYGLYGEEDADYCLRCHHAGIRKHTYAAESLIRLLGNTDEEEYARTKKRMHDNNVGKAKGEGIFALNLFLYEKGLRALNVPLKYEVASIHGIYVELKENPGYGPYMDKLAQCREIFNASGHQPVESDIDAMRKILAS